MSTHPAPARTASATHPALLAPPDVLDLEEVRRHLRQLNIAVTSKGLYVCACDALTLLGEVERLTAENTRLKGLLVDGDSPSFPLALALLAEADAAHTTGS